MDNVYKYNKERWEALVRAGALFTRPWLDLDDSSAREKLNLDDVVGDVTRKSVLCLGGGGGQQSAAFSVLGAKVTVLDISDGQLEKDQAVARHYDVEIKTVQGDMRDLSTFEDDSFDLVWHPYSLNFVPSSYDVFREVARVLRKDGIYHFMAANPFALGIGTGDWNGDGYTLRQYYQDGSEITYRDEDWVFQAGVDKPEIPGPREYRQTLSTLINGLLSCGFVLVKVKEFGLGEYNLDAEPGSWDHLVTVIPPWIKFWVAYRPEVVGSSIAT